MWTVKWTTDELLPQVDFSQDHMCRDWDAINEWMASRRIDHMEFFHNLEHPLYGRDGRKVPKSGPREVIITDFTADGRIEVVGMEKEPEVL